MKTLFDTSVLVPALVASLAQHSRAHPWLDRAIAEEFEWCVSAHTLAETYAVLTTLPIVPRILPDQARRMIHESITQHASIVPLSAADYSSVIGDLAHLGLTGRIIYDAMVCKAAKKAGVQRLLTFNIKDFQRVWPEGAAIVQVP